MGNWKSIANRMLEAHSELSKEVRERIFTKLNLIDDLCIRCDGHLTSRQIIATVIAEEILKGDS